MMNITLTAAEVMEAVEGYWGLRKAGQRVKLTNMRAMMGDSYAFTGNPLEQNTIEITVNSRPHSVSATENLTYNDICTMAGHPNQQLTVVYVIQGTHEDGSLWPGKTIVPRPGMRFDACDTSNA